MEFISNLIKRPISLVLNDSVNEQQQQQQPTTSAKSQTPPPPIITLVTSNNFDLTAEQQQLQQQQQRNNCVVNNNSKQIASSDKSLNCNNNNCKEPPVRNNMSTNTAVVDLNARGDYEPHHNLLNSSSNSNSNSNSSSSSNTAATIEELLVQINDNLNQAEIAQHGDGVSDLLGATSTAHSSLATKSLSTNKLPQTPRSPVFRSTTPTIFLASSPSSTHIAAGSAETTSKDNNPQIDTELKSDPLDQNHLSNHSTGVNIINKFVGLTEYDESSIPELPDCLNPNIEEQLKLIFEENLIPTLTASPIAVLAAASKKDGTPKSLQLPVNETDTALSSDNETFTECQTFHDVNSAISVSVRDISDMGFDHISDAETFRSALTYNNTTIEDLDEQINATMENVADIPLEESCSEPNQSWHELVTSINEDDAPFSAKNVSVQELATNVMLDGHEPMDVDMDVSSQYLQYSMSVTLTADHVNSSGKENTVLEATLENDKTLRNISECNHLGLTQENTKEINNAENKIETEIEIKNKHSVNEFIENKVEATQDAENVSLLTAKSDYENKPPLAESNSVPIQQETKISNECNSAADTSTVAHNDNMKQNIEPTSSLLTLNSFVDDALTVPTNGVTNSVTSTASNNDITINFNVDNNSSCTPSEKNSTQFPLKQKPDNVHFPRSPDNDKPIIFLKKSEYSEKLLSSPKKKRALNIDLPLLAVHSTPELNETININDTNSPGSEVHLMPYNANLSPDFISPSASPSNPLDCTFETNSLATAATNANVSSHSNEAINISDASSNLSPCTLPTPNVNKLNCTFGANNFSSSPQFNDANSPVCQLPVIDYLPSPAAPLSTSPTYKLDSTFNTNGDGKPIMRLQKINATEINALNLNQSAEAKKRYTFTVTETETQEKLNESSEAMDVDSEMELAEVVPQSSSSTKGDKNQEVDLTTPYNVEHHTSPTFHTEMLSAKEKTTCNSRDEKDIFVEKCLSPAIDELFIFKTPSVPCAVENEVASGGVGKPFHHQQDFTIDEHFQNDHKLFLNPSDIDYLYTKGNKNVQVDDNHRSSLLLKFDPLLGRPIHPNQPEKQEHLLQKIFTKNIPCVNSAIEENEEEPDENHTANIAYPNAVDRKQINNSTESAKSEEVYVNEESKEELLQAQPERKNNARMSVDVIKDIQIENDCNKSIENSNTQLDDKQSKFNMDELEKKIKNEVLKTEDIEKKLKDAEQREESLIKRITEKEKCMVKMNSVIEAYEKAIAELISEKEQLIQSYEKQLAQVKIDRDSNYHHLTSLETTFSDLHVKYEKSKEMTTQLKASEESLLAEKKQNLENLRLQEQRYEKMKNHAIQQLETANRKLETQAKEYSIDTTKLKALLKKEEISRASITEQLQQKSRENAELVKICDELINGQGS